MDTVVGKGFVNTSTSILLRCAVGARRAYHNNRSVE